MKELRHANWSLIWGSNLWFRRSAAGSTRGEYDRELYKRRNEVKRLFRRLKAFRCIFSRFEKLDEMFVAFIHFAFVMDGLIYINTP